MAGGGLALAWTGPAMPDRPDVPGGAPTGPEATPPQSPRAAPNQPLV
jgi:hypothetical protein